jgi:hypothetical protein
MTLNVGFMKRLQKTLTPQRVFFYFFDFCVGTHHEGLAPERNREHSIRDQMVALNVGFMERLRP